MIVAGTQVRIAHQFAAFAALNQHQLGMRLDADHTVDHHGTRLLQARSQRQVGLLIEARAQLDYGSHFLAGARRVDQRIDDFRSCTAAIERLLDRQHARILGGLMQQVDHRRERFIRVQ